MYWCRVQLVWLSCAFQQTSIIISKHHKLTCAYITAVLLHEVRKCNSKNERKTQYDLVPWWRHIHTLQHRDCTREYHCQGGYQYTPHDWLGDNGKQSSKFADHASRETNDTGYEPHIQAAYLEDKMAQCLQHRICAHKYNCKIGPLIWWYHWWFRCGDYITDPTIWLIPGLVACCIYRADYSFEPSQWETSLIGWAQTQESAPPPPPPPPRFMSIRIMLATLPIIQLVHTTVKSLI